MTVLSNIITPSNVLTTTNTATVTNKTLTSPTVAGMTVSDGTANGVTYLNGSKVLTSGSALTYDGTNFSVANGSVTAGNSGVVLVGRNSSSFPSPGAGYFRLRTHNTDGSNGGLAFDTLVSDTLTEGMRLTSTGLGIGTSSPAGKLDVRAGTGATLLVSADATNLVALNNYNSTSGFQDLKYAGSTHQFFTGTAGGGSVSERARIDASGNLLVGTTSQFLSEKLSVVTGNTVGVGVKTTGGASNATVGCWNATTSGDSNFIFFATETSITVRGSIDYNRAGGLTRYNTTSDYRAKDISGPVTNSGALIDSVPVYMGKMKWATEERPMFIAHEVPAYAHTGTKDEVDADGKPVYQQMDASALIPVMWAEIQSLRQRLAAANL